MPDDSEKLVRGEISRALLSAEQGLRDYYQDPRVQAAGFMHRVPLTPEATAISDALSSSLYGRYVVNHPMRFPHDTVSFFAQLARPERLTLAGVWAHPWMQKDTAHRLEMHEKDPLPVVLAHEGPENASFVEAVRERMPKDRKQAAEKIASALRTYYGEDGPDPEA